MDKTSTAVLDSMTEVVDELKNKGCNQNESLEHLKCIFDYHLLIDDMGKCLEIWEYILEYVGDLPTFRFELIMNSLLNEKPPVSCRY